MAYQGNNSQSRPYAAAGNYSKPAGNGKQFAGKKSFGGAKTESDSELISAHGLFTPKNKKEGSRTVATAYFKEDTTITIPAGSTMIVSETDPAKLADGSKKAQYSLRIVKYNDAK